MWVKRFRRGTSAQKAFDAALGHAVSERGVDGPDMPELQRGVLRAGQDAGLPAVLRAADGDAPPHSRLEAEVKASGQGVGAGGEGVVREYEANR